MPANPIISPSKDAIDNMLEIAAFILLLVLWILVAYSFVNLPDTIPIHFNANGEPDGFGAKSSLFTLPAVATIIFLGISYLSKKPYRLNYAVQIIESNAAVQYKLATRLLRYVKLAVIFIFLIIVFFTYLTVNGKMNGMGKWFLPIAIGLIILPTAILLYQSLRKKVSSYQR